MSYSMHLHWLLLLTAFCLPGTDRYDRTALCKHTSQPWTFSIAGPTKFPLISCTFIYRGVGMNPCVLSSKTVPTKVVLNNNFLLLEWSRQAVLCCSDVICQSQVTFLLLSGFFSTCLEQPCYIQVTHNMCKTLWMKLATWNSIIKWDLIFT